MKLSRKALKESLDSVPMDTVLLGVAGARELKLTAKQKAFAREIALGETKAGAYRKAYNSQGKPRTQSKKGQDLMKRDSVRAYAEAINRAMEVQALQTPAQLRALVVSELTRHAIDEDLPPAQRLRALQLLGTVTEVAAFTERREVIKTTDSQQARAQLMDSLMMAIKQGATDVDDSAAASLLAELNAGTDVETIETDARTVDSEHGQGFTDDGEQTPPTPDPPDAERDSGGTYA
jgi:hypothetical protein